jgi:hypothetical protein
MKNPTRNMKIDELIPDDKNANRGTERGLGMLEDSLRTYGAGRSILLDKNGKIIAGNKTIQSAADCGFTDVVVVPSDGRTIIAVQRTDLDMDADPRARELAIADNRVGQVDLDWDPQVLADLDVDLSKFWTQQELDELLAEVQGDGGEGAEAPEPQLDKAEELRDKWQAARGQIWEFESKAGKGTHRLMCGDATSGDVEVLMAGRRADAVLTDPPYGQNQAGVTNDEPEKLDGIVQGVVARLPCDNAAIVAFQSPRTFPAWLDATRKHGFLFERMLWMYKAAQCTFPWRGWILTSESILVSSIGKPHWNEKNPYSHDCYYLSEVSGELPENSGWHGSVKPLKVVADLCERISCIADVIYEPFSGSGTTFCAAEQTGRICYGMEIEPKYVAVALQRMADMGLQPKCLSVKPIMPEEQAKRGSTSKNSSSKAKSN